MALPGVLVVEAPKFSRGDQELESGIARLLASVSPQSSINRFPLVVLADDSEFTARNLSNFLWVTFTRTNPATDIHGIDSFQRNKHWGCRGALIFDARIKPQHAPPLEEDPAVSRRVDALAAPGGPLHGIL
ncbi:MAG: hypothetical protein U0903_18485 [Planctomycetales bacterium]